MKANANQIRAAIDAASLNVRLYLLHGPDEAAAREIAARLARALGPEAERVDIETGQLKGDPGRLADEAASLSLFGGARHIRVNGAGEECVEAATLLLKAERAGNPVVMIAPSLKSSAKLVKLALGDPAAMSFACYLPDGGDAEKLATAIAREHGLRMVGGTPARLAAASGSDRAVMTRELEKLALYLDAAPERPRELDDAALDAIGADLGDAELARAIEAAIEGSGERLGHELTRLTAAGTSPIPLLRQLVRRLMTLAELRAEIDGGSNAAAVLDRVFFRDRAATARALRNWPAVKIAAGIARARRAERLIMATSTAGGVIGESAMVAVARMASRDR